MNGSNKCIPAGIMAQHQQALDWGQSALALQSKDPADSASTHNVLAENYSKLGQNKEAVKYYQLGLAADIKTYGENHRQVATIRSRLGNAYYQLGQYKRALDMFEKAMATHLLILPPGHEDIVTTLASIRMTKDILLKSI